MATAPFAPASCILLPAVSSDRLLQHLSGLLRSAGHTGSVASQEETTTTAADGLAQQTSHVIQLLPSGLIGALKEVIVTASNSTPSILAAPALLTAATMTASASSRSYNNSCATTSAPPTTATNNASCITTNTSTTTTSATAGRGDGTTATIPGPTATVPIEVINAILRLPETVMTSSSNLRMQTFHPLDPSSLTLHEYHVTSSTAMATVPSVSISQSNSLRPKCDSPEKAGHHSSTEETTNQITPEPACSSSLLLHRLLTGEDANRVRSRSELLLADAEGSRESEEEVSRTNLSADDDDASERTRVGELPADSQQPIASQSILANHSTPVTVGQLVGLLREVCQLIANQKADQTASQPVSLNTVILKHLMPHLAEEGTEGGRRMVADSNPTCGATTSTTNSTNRTQPATCATVSLSCQRAPVLHDCAPTYTTAPLIPSRPTSPPVDRSLAALPDRDFASRLMDSEFIRPRCHSDHQPNRRSFLQNSLDQQNHGIYSQKQQYQHQHQQQLQPQQYQQRRPRSYSKAERRCHSRLRAGLLDVRTGLSTECDPNSSLFAKLVLTPESSWGTTTTTTTTSSNSSSPTPDVPASLGEGIARTGYDSLPNNRYSSFSSCSSATLLPLPRIVGNRQQPAMCYLCAPTDCQKAFLWLRESDEFVGQHCTGLAHDTLVLTATTVRPSVVLSEPQVVLNKIWHQLLLICMMENKFAFSITPLEANTRGCSSHRHSAATDSLSLRPPADDMHPVRLRFTNDITTGGHRKSGVAEGQLRVGGGDGDVVPQTDSTFVSQLRALIATAVDLNLQPETYRLIRLSVLAQAAYPDYYPDSYTNQLSDLESHLNAMTAVACVDEKEAAVSRLVGTLRLLNKLHSIDATRLQFFLRLSGAPIAPLDSRLDAQLERSEARDQVLRLTLKPDPDSRPGPPRSNASSPTSTTTSSSIPGCNSLPLTASSGSTSGVGGGTLVGASKRKATAVSRRRFGSITEDVPRLTQVTSAVEPTLRCRANTVSGDAGAATGGGTGHVRHCKTARMS